MATVNIGLKLKNAIFFFVNNIIVGKEWGTYILDTGDRDMIITILRGIQDEKIESDISVDVLLGYLGGGSGEGGTGTVGPQGPMGPAGPKGDKGDTGARGASGLQGPIGPQGPQGPAGKDGSQGLQGIQGIQGLDGAKGDKGDAGPAGIQGAQGPKGEDGLQGIQGPMGPAGGDSTTTSRAVDIFNELSKTYSDADLDKFFYTVTVKTLLARTGMDTGDFEPATYSTDFRAMWATKTLTEKRTICEYYSFTFGGEPLYSNITQGNDYGVISVMTVDEMIDSLNFSLSPYSVARLLLIDYGIVVDAPTIPNDPPAVPAH